MPKTAIKPEIRWMIRRELPQVLEIEAESFACPWGEGDFIDTLGERNTIGMVAEVDRQIAAFCVYELHKDHFFIVNMAVRQSFRRQRVATAIMNHLKRKLHVGRRDQIAANLCESNLDGQLFFRHQGFRAVRILRDRGDTEGRDAYRFRFKVTE